MYEYDATHVYTTLEEAQSYFATPGQISAIEVKVDDAENADRMTPAVIAAVARPELRVRDWREINKNLFSALKLERIATFLILSIEIIVASFCIVCTLLLMMTEKSKEIAILKALGATDGAILRTFMTEGIIIGGIGTVLGVSTGVAHVHGPRVVRAPARPGRLLHRPPPHQRERLGLRGRHARGPDHLHHRHDLPGQAGGRAAPRRRPPLRVTAGMNVRDPSPYCAGGGGMTCTRRSSPPGYM